MVNWSQLSWQSGTPEERGLPAYQRIKLSIDISYVGEVIAVFLFFQHGGRPPFWIVTSSTPGHPWSIPYERKFCV